MHMMDRINPEAETALGLPPLIADTTCVYERLLRLSAALDKLLERTDQIIAASNHRIVELEDTPYRNDEIWCIKANAGIEVIELFGQVGLINTGVLRSIIQNQFGSSSGKSLKRDVARVWNLATAYFDNASPGIGGAKDSRMQRARQVAAEMDGSVTADAIEKARQRVKGGWLEFDPESLRFRVQIANRLMRYLPSKSGRPRGL
jgi:hypothetical protein